MPHYLIKKQLQNTDKKHTKKMKKYLHISENSVTHTTQLANKGLNTASFCLFLAGHTVGLWKERRKNGEREP